MGYNVLLVAASVCFESYEMHC